MVSTHAPSKVDAFVQPPVDPSSILNVNVGVLGHVDSGKTSLVKTLSTFLSTAALDKSKQSRQRGMTLDLGFSCFFLDMPEHLTGYEEERLQMTLVDCPGHASLIRTIIGGAQIIDMVLLVVDAFKGWQAQTTECLVLAELTSPKLVVALNKVDLFKPEEREVKLEQARRDVRKRLKNTRFADAKLVGVSACVGGEKVAAVAGGGDAGCATLLQSGTNETFNVDTLVRVLQQELPPPKRTREGPFYFSVDHCFPIRGQGTVLTGTVLNGTAGTNSIIEFPTLGLERKIKSIQMFRRKVSSISQGDRAGICVSNLDAKLLERGVAATPGAVQLLKGALALVRKVPYYHGTLMCGAKFHISVGHTTVMATVTFWGADELAKAMARMHQSDDGAETETIRSQNATFSSKKKNLQLLGHSSLGGDADMAGLPRFEFDFDQDFVQQDRLLESLRDEATQSDTSSLLHWALLDFQTPVYCPIDSLVIGSRLDAVDSAALGGTASSCRLAFSGRLVEKMDPSKDFTKIRLYTPKERRGVIRRLGDPHRRESDKRTVRYEVFGTDLFKKETNMKIFVGMKLVTERGEVGVIKSSFGTTGKFRVYFPGGTEAREGDALLLKFKRYAHDEKKEMHQDLELPPSVPGARLENEKGRKKEKVAGGKQQGYTKGRIAPSSSAAESATASPIVGEVTLLKGDVLENGKYSMAIVSGFFTPEVDIRTKKGMQVVITTTKEKGVIAGPFGKAGKCKVSFDDGVSAKTGSKAELLQ